MKGPAEGADAEPASPTEDPKPTRMLPREQQVGYVLAGVAGAVAVGAATTKHSVLIGALGVGAAIVLALAVRHGQRIITAFTGFLVGIALQFFFPLEVACLIFSGYLMMRTSNAQGKQRRAQAPMSASERRAAAEARAAERAERRKATGRRGAAPEAVVAKLPPKSRRYTPPKGKPTRRP